MGYAPRRCRLQAPTRGWQLCRGITGNVRVERMAGLPWNQWQLWRGIRNRDHDMDMVRRDVPLEDIDAGLLALFTDDGPDPFCHLTAQHFMAVLDNPDDMEVDGKRCMGAMAIVTHALQSTQNRLKLPPKGGGFAPPNRRQLPPCRYAAT